MPRAPLQALLVPADARYSVAVRTRTMERHEAHQILFRGQSNVAQMAKRLEISLEELQASFREYVAVNPIDEDVWKGDIELGWPWA